MRYCQTHKPSTLSTLPQSASLICHCPPSVQVLYVHTRYKTTSSLLTCVPFLLVQVLCEVQFAYEDTSRCIHEGDFLHSSEIYICSIILLCQYTLQTVEQLIIYILQYLLHSVLTCFWHINCIILCLHPQLLAQTFSMNQLYSSIILQAGQLATQYTHSSQLELPRIYSRVMRARGLCHVTTAVLR